jgi:hypothetical protein
VSCNEKHDDPVDGAVCGLANLARSQFEYAQMHRNELEPSPPNAAATQCDRLAVYAVALAVVLRNAKAADQELAAELTRKAEAVVMIAGPNLAAEQDASTAIRIVLDLL